MPDFSRQMPTGRGIIKQRVGGVYVNALIRVIKLDPETHTASIVEDFPIPMIYNQWKLIGYNYDWWRVIKDKQIIVKRNKNKKGNVFYDDSLDDMLGGNIQKLG